MALYRVIQGGGFTVHTLLYIPFICVHTLPYFKPSHLQVETRYRHQIFTACSLDEHEKLYEVWLVSVDAFACYKPANILKKTYVALQPPKCRYTCNIVFQKRKNCILFSRKWFLRDVTLKTSRQLFALKNPIHPVQNTKLGFPVCNVEHLV